MRIVPTVQMVGMMMMILIIAPFTKKIVSTFSMHLAFQDAKSNFSPSPPQIRQGIEVQCVAIGTSLIDL
jgi:hypothetical protein